MTAWILEHLVLSGVMLAIIAGTIVTWMNQRCPLKYRRAVHKYLPEILDTVGEAILEDEIELPYEEKIAKLLSLLREKIEKDFDVVPSGGLETYLEKVAIRKVKQV